MKENLKKVHDWYSDERSYAYMSEASKKGLKSWEQKVVSEYFQHNTHILNIGCGMGREAFVLYDLGFKITAIDISESILTRAKQLASESERSIEFLLTNGIDLPFEKETFDVIIIWSQTFGLLYGQDNQFHMLNECKRVLKTGGILSFSTHEKEFEENNYSQYVDGKKFYAYEDCYWEIFSIDELTSLAQKVGLNVLACHQGKIYYPEDGIIIHCICKK